MGIGHFFVDRPIFATVLSLIMVILGLVAYTQLPVAQYPEIAPPSIVVRASYPGADADTVAQTVANPLEQEINGVEGMLYLSSYSTSDGNMSLTVTFALGTDLDQAQVLVQNRVQAAEPRLPEEVRRLGVTTAKSSPDLMMVVHMLSPDDTFDQLYVSNYARNRVRDILVRLSGVGEVQIFGERQYALRIWLDTDKLAAYGITPGDVTAALREQNVQVSGGALGTLPNEDDNAFQYIVTTQGRFEQPREFANIIVRSTEDGRIVRVRDIARVELGAREYTNNSYLNNKPAVALGIFQRPGSNALATAEEIVGVMEELKTEFPPGLDYQVVYNPTEFISASIDEVYKTIFEAAVLVVIVILVFLQSWRTAMIPILAIPVSLIGTFAVMLALGYSLNMLTLFGLVLAIGIVVDDAIVVVENVERNIANGLSPREAARRTMTEVAGALVATSLVLIAVFVPTAFVPGISGQFYTQFAVTISVSTVLSTINSLTLSPAMAAVFLRPHPDTPSSNPLTRIGTAAAGAFNSAFDRLAGVYGGFVSFTARRISRLILTLGVFGSLLYGAYHMLNTVPTGFIPTLDQGYAIVVVQLPSGASLERTDDVVKRASDIVNATPGITDAVAFAGFSGATFTNASNQGVIFARFDSFENRLAQGLPAHAIIGQLFGRMQAIEEAFIIAIPPPPVRGIGQGGGFKMQVQDVERSDINRVLQASYAVIGRAAQEPGVIGVFTTFTANSPQIYLEVDRVRAQMLNVPIANIFEALSTNLGATYVNDFNTFGRIYQVRAQADEQFRRDPADILRLKVRSSNGALVPLGTLVEVQHRAGPDLIQRYNQLTSVPVQGTALPGVSTGEALEIMERVAAEVLPTGTTFEWTELAYQEKTVGNTAMYIFALAVVFAFLVLAAQYESWVLPLAIILIVPTSIFAALLGVSARGLDNNILTQVGLIVLVGLAAKNAILIVEFAKQLEDEGEGLIAATVEAARLRLRPILMTAFSFILGVVPLAIATGPGAEMRQAIGTAVFSGMLGVTLFGLVFTPAFYVVLRRLLGTPTGQP
jgi:HAE1 family hydrophobic/amphiphilic exporter-1